MQPTLLFFAESRVMNTWFLLSLFSPLGLCSPFCSLSSIRFRDCRPIYTEISQAWFEGAVVSVRALLYESEEQWGWTGNRHFYIPDSVTVFGVYISQKIVQRLFSYFSHENTSPLNKINKMYVLTLYIHRHTLGFYVNIVG